MATYFSWKGNFWKLWMSKDIWNFSEHQSVRLGTKMVKVCLEVQLVKANEQNRNRRKNFSVGCYLAAAIKISARGALDTMSSWFRGRCIKTEIVPCLSLRLFWKWQIKKVACSYWGWCLDGGRYPSRNRTPSSRPSWQPFSPPTPSLSLT